MNQSNSEATSTVLETGHQSYIQNYGHASLVIDRGEGCHLWDMNGKEYIDLGTGISVTNFGHRHPEMEKALQEQMGKVWHTSNLYYLETPIQLAEQLIANSFGERVFFCNSGAEANEAAIKLARKFASATRPPEKRTILTFEGSFHGRTLATVTATAQPKYQEGFEPLPGGFRHCNFNDIPALEAAFDDTVCAVLLEPVQGEGGVNPAQPGFLKRIRELCDANDALLMVDEVQCGMGRSGHLWAHEFDDIKPDVMTLAKALGNGLPIGALVAGPKAADVLQPGSHGSTFGGNPLSCAVALAALRLAKDDETLDNVARQGQTITSYLEGLDRELSLFKEIRGRGLMLGAELNDQYAGEAGAIGKHCTEQGLLLLQAGPNVVRFLPPLIIDEVTVASAMDRFDKAIRAWLAERAEA